MNALKSAAIICALGLIPSPVWACAVCFGGPEEPLTKGMSMGILSMLGVVGSVMSVFAMFFVYLGKKAARMPATDTTEKTD